MDLKNEVPTGTLVFIGTATTLIRYGELTILTDPNFLHRGQRAYLGYGLTAKRLTEPALAIGQLPPLDAVVLSHLHGDHWDRNAQRGLGRDTMIITTPHAAKRLQWRGFSRALGIRTWGSHELIRGDDRVRITAMPGRHAPLPVRRLLPPVMGSMLEFGPAVGGPRLRVYLSGDTLLIEELQEIPQRYPDIDAAVLHLGGTRLPGGLMVTMDAVQGADLMQLLIPKMTIPVHFDDYHLFRSPLADFRAEVTRRGLLDQVRFVERGDTVALNPIRPAVRDPRDPPTTATADGRVAGQLLLFVAAFTKAMMELATVRTGSFLIRAADSCRCNSAVCSWSNSGQLIESVTVS